MAGKNKNQSKKGPGSRVVADNRRARHEYHVLDTLEVGIVLTGTEIKSIRAGKVSLADSFARIENGEAYLLGCHIAPYEQGNINNHEPTRTRKLLLKKLEIKKLLGKTKEKGLTLIPMKMYFHNAWIKIELGLCKGKTTHDKRETIANRDAKREIERALKSR